MTGQVPDAGPYIEQMDILVNASDPEPFGIVLLEGMARGVPVLAVDAGGPAEFVEHGADRLLARSGRSPQALADALEPLLASAELRARARRGRSRALPAGVYRRGDARAVLRAPRAAALDGQRMARAA